MFSLLQHFWDQNLSIDDKELSLYLILDRNFHVQQTLHSASLLLSFFSISLFLFLYFTVPIPYFSSCRHLFSSIKKSYVFYFFFTVALSLPKIFCPLFPFIKNPFLYHKNTNQKYCLQQTKINFNEKDIFKNYSSTLIQSSLFYSSVLMVQDREFQFYQQGGGQGGRGVELHPLNLLGVSQPLLPPCVCP